MKPRLGRSMRKGVSQRKLALTVAQLEAPRLCSSLLGQLLEKGGHAGRNGVEPPAPDVAVLLDDLPHVRMLLL
eukprot:17685-Eustigmatos_ZCMA.PRE.1